MRCKYPDKDLSQRLDHSICRYKGDPVYIRYAGTGTLFGYDLTNKADSGNPKYKIDANDPNFDISTIPMGYFQASKNTVMYVSRKPGRIYKQGVNSDSLVCISLNKAGNREWDGSIYTAAFRDMILDKYPPLHASIKRMRVSTNRLEIAVTRDIAIEWVPELLIIQVYFKNELIGFLPQDTMTVIIPSTEKAWVMTKYLSELDWEVQ